jgi:hypothetical protein
MTSSIPATCLETITPNAAPAAAAGPLPGSAAGGADFAGVLAGTVPVPGPAAPGLNPGEVLVSPGVPAGVAGAETPAAVPSGPGLFPPLGSPGAIRRFAFPAGPAVRIGTPTRPVAEAPVPAGATPTRAEQEEAMAMLAALFPAMSPAAPVVPLALDVALPAIAGPGPSAVVEAGEDPGIPSAVALPAGPEIPTVAFATSAGRATPWPGSPPMGSGTSLPPVRDAAEGELSAFPAEVGQPTGSSGLPLLPPAVTATELPAGLVPGTAESGQAWPATTAAPAVESDCAVVAATVVRPDGVPLARWSVAEGGTPALSQQPAREEKSAGVAKLETASVARENRGSGKKLLSSSNQELAKDAPDDGTTAANTGDTMKLRLTSSFDFALRPTGAEAKAADPVTAPVSRGPAEVAAPGVISTVLEVIEAQESSKLRPVPAVHLRMQVAGETVGIQVELRDNTVQTRFTTVSPELREALAREWQVARSETPAGAPRLLDPVFNTNAERGGASSQGQDAASQQQQQARTWTTPWEQSLLPFSRRARQPAADNTLPDAPALDDRLLSAIA